MKLKQRDKPINEPSKMLYEYAEDESYKRYKHRQYRNLILKSLLAFMLGLLVKFFLIKI